MVTGENIKYNEFSEKCNNQLSYIQCAEQVQKRLTKKDDEATDDDEEEVEEKPEKRKKRRKRSVTNHIKTLEKDGSESEDEDADDDSIESMSITEDDEMKIRDLVESDETIMTESVSFKLME